MPYKILSLDGGATWSMVQARVLLDIYKDINGHELIKKFDMVIATSGGSVLLGLLCNNMKLSEIVSFYTTQSKVRQIYPPLLLWEKFFLQLFRKLSGIGPRYHTQRKFERLRQAFIDKDQMHKDNPESTPIVDSYLNELPSIICEGKKLQLIITAFDYFRQRVTFFRSNIGSKTNKFSNKFYQITLGEAIHASCNAPINYYDKPASVTLDLLASANSERDKRTSWFWDGAIAGFNNPVLAGLVEAVTNNPTLHMNDYHILSLGTHLSRKAVITGDNTSTNESVQQNFLKNKKRPFVEWQLRFKFLNDIKTMSKSIISDPPDSATFIAYSFLNPSLDNNKSSLVRINPCIIPDNNNGIYFYPKVYENDKTNFMKLMKMDFDIFKEDELNLIATMCDRFIVNDAGADCLQNQLIRGEMQTGAAGAGYEYIGYATYREAKARWLELTKD